MLLFQEIAGAGHMIRRNAENVAARWEMQAARLEAHVRYLMVWMMGMVQRMFLLMSYLASGLCFPFGGKCIHCSCKQHDLSWGCNPRAFPPRTVYTIVVIRYTKGEPLTMGRFYGIVSIARTIPSLFRQWEGFNDYD
ncbi:hypothetical protein L1987_79313 [Smallanthus sonchifolius]|uniref:Uncharacterized protein n=1 Tax=Smallanthus sonchifolius TaxID=185202 RepID=A0ACB8ZFN9_9ASTR|nr:hypothetical protein L1987_79313 [Smallanthus sonchifolius]